MEKTLLGLRPGSIIQDTYRITDLLGEGGMGATFSGVNMATGHEVAIKVIATDFARDKKATDLFRREANLMRSIQNDAVVRYETTMLDATGQLYLVMEYIKGKPLSHFLNKGARLAAKDVLKLGQRLASGLDAIHQLNIVHRDLSPDNVIIPDEDILGAKLIDFGVATDTIGTDKSILGSSFAGKISYASPEQLGIGGKAVTNASDIYSLGLVLLRTAGMKVPGAGGSLATAIDARRMDIDLSKSGLAAPLRSTLKAMLHSDPAQRPDNLTELFKTALIAEEKRLAEGEQARDTSATAKKPAKLKPIEDDADLLKKPPVSNGSSKGPIIGGIAIILVCVAGIAAFFLFQNSSGGSGASLGQAETAKAALEADDPFVEVTSLIAQGGSDNLNAAFGALMAMARDESLPDAQRGQAALRIAQMYDPDSYDPARSPFPAPNANAARRFYSEARDLGAAEAEEPLARLGSE